MSIALSICIPTLNRCQYLITAIKSIFDSKFDYCKVEICISNNASNENYTELDQLLEKAPEGLRVRYFIQKTRYSIDEHMYLLKNLVDSPYVYFLGDDDFFQENQIDLLLNLIKQQNPDLAIFNGILINSEGKAVGSHFNLRSKCYHNAAQAFFDLRDKGMFGSVLVKKTHLNDYYFEKLFGTSHGYGCYWFSLLSNHVNNIPVKVIIPDFPLVSLRVAEKSYSHLEVYYRDIPFEISVYQRYLAPGLPQKLNWQFKTKYEKRVSSLIFLTQLHDYGYDIGIIKSINFDFYFKYRFKIFMSIFLSKSGIYVSLRYLYRLIFKSTRV